ncbi:MAG: DoxX family protein [Bradyrhizobium sp.]|nr:DoxX family protein [Bradyrhizobium sp.]
MNGSKLSLPGLAATIEAVIDWLACAAQVVAPPLLRIALAVPFFKSGLTKWDGLSLAPTAQFLFEDQFKLHIFGQVYNFPFPDTLALLDSVAEIILPVLVVIGLATRFSALGLLVMTGVIQLVVPEGWANFHLPWASLAVAIIALGPGRLSLDHLIKRFVPRIWKSRP